MIRFLTESSIIQSAELLLKEQKMLSTLPIDVEGLVERKLGIEIVPISGFQSLYGVDGMLSQDLTRISVDERVMVNVAPRYRFTLAHEVGHYYLHGDAIREHLDNPGDAELMLWEVLGDEDYKRAEFQANCFASALLMPTSHVQALFDQIQRALAQHGRNFDDLDDYAKVKVLRSNLDSFCVSADALRIRLIREGLVQPFDNPEAMRSK